MTIIVRVVLSLVKVVDSRSENYCRFSHSFSSSSGSNSYLVTMSVVADYRNGVVKVTVDADSSKSCCSRSY